MKKLIVLLLTTLPMTAFCEPNKNDVETLCLAIFKAASITVIGKNGGLPKTDFLSRIPSVEELTKKPITNEKLLQIEKRKIVLEVYKYEDFDRWVYPAYKAEVCFKRFSKKSSIKLFPFALQELTLCNKLSNKRDKMVCASKVANSNGT